MELRILKQTQQDRDEELAQYLDKPVSYLHQYKIKSPETICVMHNKKAVQNKDGSISEAKLIDLYRTFKHLKLHGHFRTMMYTSRNHRPATMWKMFNGLDGKLLLNFGSGVGTHSIRAMECGAKVEAMDVWGPITEFSTWRLKLRSYEALSLSHDYILPREHYDAAVCVDVLEHVVDPTKTFLMIAASLKPGATFSLKVSNIIKDTSGHLAENVQNWRKNGPALLKKMFTPIDKFLYVKKG